MRLAAACLGLFTVFGPGAALAQIEIPGPPETIYSDAQRAKDLEVSQRLVGTLLAPSFSLENQFARWKDPVCPHVYGLTPITAWMIEHHIREVAKRVGAPVDRNDPCVPNIGIIFTPQPQASLMSIAAVRPTLVMGGNQKARVRFPIQAFYASVMTDFNGTPHLDVPYDVSNPAEGGAMWVRANDSRLHTGLTTHMATSTVLVDTKVVMGMTLGELGDYLAFMTLSRARKSGACQNIASISNLMAPGCDAAYAPRSLSHIDVALLTALYEIPDSPEVLQKQRIVGAMRRSLEKQFGKD